MRWLKWLTRLMTGRADAPRLPGPRSLPSYVAMGRYIAGGVQLDPRLHLLVTQLAAELSGCRWCIEQGRHRWRRAFLPRELLRALRSHRASPLFSAKEHAALAFAEAVTRYADAAGGIPAGLLTEVRRYCSEPEVAALTTAAAAEHFFNTGSGALGADAEGARNERAQAQVPARDACRAASGSAESRGGAPIAVRNLW